MTSEASKSKFGTWRVGKSAKSGCAFTIYSGPEIDGGGCYEAHIPGDPTPYVASIAAMVAAAPDMLAALRRIAEATEISAADMDVVLSAISKAEAS